MEFTAGQIFAGIVLAVFSAALGGMATALRIGRKVDLLSQRVGGLVEGLSTMDSDVAAMVPLGGRIEALLDRVQSIATMLNEHVKLEGHTGTLQRLAVLEDRYTRLNQDLSRVAHIARSADHE